MTAKISDRLGSMDLQEHFPPELLTIGLSFNGIKLIYLLPL